MGIKRDLIVATACGMKSAARRADCVRQSRLNVHVNIFKRDAEIKFACVDFLQNFFQARADFFSVVVGNNFLRG